MTELTLPDGRRMACTVMGDPSGRPVVILHGTPGSARHLAAFDGPARDLGVALIAPDRAGFGSSDYDPARTISSGARDVGAVIAQLQIAGCPVVGWSGGGPTALACGVLLASQISSIATLGGVAPSVPRDPCVPPDGFVVRTASRYQPAIRALFALTTWFGRAMPERAIKWYAASLVEPDAVQLRDNPAVRTALIDDISHPSPTAARAAALEYWLFARQWDIDIADISVPAHIWHGTDDHDVPVAHSRSVAARCPTAQLHLIPGAGHLPFSYLGDIVAALPQ